MKSVSRYLRLLPAVVIVGTGLLAIKGVDIARAAQATAVADPDAPDNSGLAPTDNGGAAAATHDFASDDGAGSSAGEVDVLSSLTRRRAELDARERALAMRENLLSAGEGRVDQKIGALKNLQTQIQALLTQRDDKQKAQIASLVKTYSAMKPKDAARIFNSLSDDVLLPVAKDMKSDVLAPVLAAMNPDAAQKLTVKLATLLKLPETAPAVCPDPAAAPGASADLTAPAPLQTAALSPPGSTPVVSPLPLPPAPPTATPPAAAPSAPVPAQAAAAPPPKPHAPPVHHTAPAKPATPPPAKPTVATATPPAKPVAAPVTTPPVTAPAAPAATPPAKPATQAASAPPTALTPPQAPGG